MTGSYRALNYDELIEAHSKLSAAASYLRPVVETPDLADTVFQAAIGPTEVSTSVELLPASVLPVWDVNGYYRACGVQWPYRVTRRELTRSYNAIGGPNNNDHFAAYAFRRLRDDEFRTHYDRRPLGQPVDDEYRWREMFEQASLWAAEQSKAIGKVVTYREILGDDILHRIEAQEEAERQQEALNYADRDPDESGENDQRPTPWPFAYYLWNSRCSDDERLAEWQRLLIKAFSNRGLSLHLAVGYFDRAPASAVRMRHRTPDDRYVEILFLHQDVDPSADLADVVVGTYHTCPYGTPMERPLYLHDRS